ncbi:MAG TPA: TraR/DksA family transcriptional regulator [Spongiibacteraceae bacterium]|nr:TraR/DksA family transcriptional regulator [Spongiibacteraceae bacterium]
MNETEVRTRLLRKRDEIFARANSLHKDLYARTEPYSADFAEQAVELENLDVLFQLDTASRAELSAINNSIDRLAVGSYGICSRCAKPINPARLNALPHAETCIDCAL